MSSFVNLVAASGWLFSFGTADPVVPSGVWTAAVIPAASPLVVGEPATGAFGVFIAEGIIDDSWNQVRVEQRMIIRIAPRMSGSMLAPPPDPRFTRQLEQPRFFERKTDKCLPIASIAGVQIESQDRLLLVTRSRKLIGASLEKSCRARDFYSGFYVDRSEDGRLCAGRDTIHSRAGVNCAITKMRELVPDED